MTAWIQPASGTYDPSDVTFLMVPSNAPTLGVVEKELAIQSGTMHYSECISEEAPPSSSYMTHYNTSLYRVEPRFAEDIVNLSMSILATCSKEAPVIFVSLARAGTPVGVLLHREATRRGFDSSHYSISIVRDKGLDLLALDEVARRNPNLSQLFFVDGWTGKGTITRQLHSSIDTWNTTRHQSLSPRLAVVADPCGWADFSATHDDYLPPHAILNATISGCMSRTTCTDINQPHGTRFFETLVPFDESVKFVNALDSLIQKVSGIEPTPPIDLKELRHQSREWFETMKTQLNATSDNHLKPGIPETTRVMLRRTPKLLGVKNLHNPDVAHLLYLAQEKHVRVEVFPDMPYEAIGLIEGGQGD